MSILRLPQSPLARGLAWPPAIGEKGARVARTASESTGALGSTGLSPLRMYGFLVLVTLELSLERHSSSAGDGERKSWGSF